MPFPWQGCREVWKNAGDKEATNKLAIFDNRTVDVVGFSDPVPEANVLSVSRISPIDKRFSHFVAVRSHSLVGERNRRSILQDSVQETVADGRELQEPAFPDGIVRQRVRVEAAGQFAAVARLDAAELHADAASHGRPAATEDAGLHAAQLDVVPRVAGPGGFVLITPVPEFASIKTWVFHQQSGHARAGLSQLSKVLGFFGVEVVDAVSVDARLPARPVFRMQRLAVEFKSDRAVQMSVRVLDGGFDVCLRYAVRRSQAQEKLQQVTHLRPRHRRSQVVRHQRADLAPRFDVVFRNRDERIFQPCRVLDLELLIVLFDDVPSD